MMVLAPIIRRILEAIIKNHCGLGILWNEIPKLALEGSGEVALAIVHRHQGPDADGHSDPRRRARWRANVNSIPSPAPCLSMVMLVW